MNLVPYNAILCITLILCLSPSCKNEEPSPPENAYEMIRGVDGSMIAELMEQNVVFTDRNGLENDIISILKNNGVNTIRLRLWHSPSSSNSSLSQVTSIAQQLKEEGLKIWLCLHYSDSWADPGKQETPSSWEGLTLSRLKNEAAQYTYSVVKTIQPDFVQIGNEINNGMLHPTGTLDNFNAFSELLSTCLTSAKSGNPDVKTILHLAGHAESLTFINNYTLPEFDILGISYYPKWHGKRLSELEANLRQLSSNNDFDVVIAETAYPFTLNYADDVNNIVGLNEQLIDGIPPSPEGQQKFLNTIKQMCQIMPGCVGFCYWGADWVSFPSSLEDKGSPWENQALFDFDAQALPALETFNN